MLWMWIRWLCTDPRSVGDGLQYDSYAVLEGTLCVVFLMLFTKLLQIPYKKKSIYSILLFIFLAATVQYIYSYFSNQFSTALDALLERGVVKK